MAMFVKRIGLKSKFIGHSDTCRDESASHAHRLSRRLTEG